MILSAKCKKCRALGEKLFLRGERCFSPKCAMVRRPYKPGAHGKTQRRRNVSEYGRQLAEKQKVKLLYGLSERQLRRYFREVINKKGSTKDLLFKKLENRIDNVIFRLGLAESRNSARQMVSHGHFLLNRKKSKTPSTELRKNDVILVRLESRTNSLFKNLIEDLKKKSVSPKHLSFDIKKLEGTVLGDPSIEELKPSFDLSLVVEFYSK